MAITSRSSAQADLLVVSGGPEVCVVDAAATNAAAAKLWRWRASERMDLPEALRDRFGHTDEGKPADGGRKVLICSSGGGCALVERPSGKVLWAARLMNPHSLELLPDNRLIAASAKGKDGDRLALFEVARGAEPLWSSSLTNAHGVIWDARRQRLWALGRWELRGYSLRDWKTATPSLAQEIELRLPTSGGHDLQLDPLSGDLLLTTEAGVYLLAPDSETFRPHPVLGGRTHVKGVSVHPRTGRLAVVQGTATQAFADTIELLNPAGSLPWPGEKLYKARWLLEP